MRHRYKWLIFFVVATVVNSVMFSEQCVAIQIGSVKAINGDAIVSNSIDEEIGTLKPGDTIKLNDSIQTELGSKVHVKLEDGSDNSLGASTEIYFYDFDRRDATQFYGADVTTGVVRFVKKLVATKPPSSYTISTPTALISIQPGDQADFVVQVFNRRQTTVTVIRGKVLIKNVLEDVPIERTVTACRRVNIEENKPPSNVLEVSSKILNDLVSMTTIPGNLLESIPDCSQGFVTNKRCPSRQIWDGSRCVPCGELGLVFKNGKCTAVDCGDCKIPWGLRCVPCSEMGLVCVKGRCVRNTCPPCAIWDGERCVSCEQFGRKCIDGRCPPRQDCPPCSVWNGWRCVSCEEFGRICLDGKCVFRPCGKCEARSGAVCIKCQELGLNCENGKCVGSPPASGKNPGPGISPTPSGAISAPESAPYGIAPTKQQPGKATVGGTERPTLEPAAPIKPDKGRSPSSQKAKPGPNELKRGNKPYRQGKQGIKPTRHPETGQPAVKQDGKKIRNENSVIGGRPDLKPEFAKPDRAPGPPLGDTPGDDDKKKRH